jgi:hypothetical protein
MPAVTDVPPVADARHPLPTIRLRRLTTTMTLLHLLQHCFEGASSSWLTRPGSPAPSTPVTAAGRILGGLYGHGYQPPAVLGTGPLQVPSLTLISPACSTSSGTPTGVLPVALGAGATPIHSSLACYCHASPACWKANSLCTITAN